MMHEPTRNEQQVIDSLLEQFDFHPVTVRLTSTMLSKSIIDANSAIRALLYRHGFVDFNSMKVGEEGKIKRDIPFVISASPEIRTVSFYRPHTKNGDPRFWISQLSANASDGDLLLLGFSGQILIATLLNKNLEFLSMGLARYLPPRHKNVASIQSTVELLTNKIRAFSNRWIQTLRKGPTGIGFTLETMLGIPANVKQDADYLGVELKSFRHKGDVAGKKLVTLFGKTPQWLGVEKGAGLLEHYGYWDESRKRTALYCTINKTVNSLGWHLLPEPDIDRMGVAYHGDIILAYSNRVLENRLLEKHPATMFVKASTRGTGANEEFKYDELVVCMYPTLEKLLSLIELNKLGLDFTLHLRSNGTARDHGYLWRIHESAIPDLYAYRRRIQI